MVDKGARTARTGAVHTLLNRTAEVGYFSIFAAQLDSNIGLWNLCLYGDGRGDNLLHERHGEPL